MKIVPFSKKLILKKCDTFQEIFKKIIARLLKKIVRIQKIIFKISIYKKVNFKKKNVLCNFFLYLCYHLFARAAPVHRVARNSNGRKSGTFARIVVIMTIKIIKRFCEFGPERGRCGISIGAQSEGFVRLLDGLVRTHCILTRQTRKKLELEAENLR